MSTRRSTSRSPARRLARGSLFLLVGMAVFAAGVGLGRATRETAEPGVRTQVRTLQPATVAPPPRTITVTVTEDG